MKQSTPLVVAPILFAIFVLTHFLVGYINYSRAGKILITGVATIGALSALSAYYKTRIWQILLIAVSFILLLNLSFHAGLRDIFGVEQDEMMIIKSIFATDIQESYEFILQYRQFLIKHLVIFLLSITAFYIVALRGSSTTQNSIGKKTVVIWVIIFMVAHLEKSIRLGNPLIYFPYYYSEWKQELVELEKLNNTLQANIDEDALLDIKYVGRQKRNTVVWVIGESSTRSNWSLYGYERDTTPLINSIKDQLYVFGNIKAAAPITVPAFKLMMTPANIKKPDLWKRYPSIIQIAKKAGYHTYWISNHTTDAHSGITYLFAKQADEFYMTNKGRARGEGSYDSSILPAYKKALQDKYAKKFIILHLLGSHPAYDFRYPKEYAHFTEVFDDKVGKDLATKGISKWAIAFRNLYDNSILYGDHIRYQTLKMLQKNRDANSSVWLYHPDHGEDVVHHNNFSGHNKNAKEQWEIPMILWLPKKISINTDRGYQLDTIESAILGLLKIEAKYYNKENDLFTEE